MSWSHQWAPYVPVARRRRNAIRKMDRLRKKGVDIQPIEIQGRKIARTFWGIAWCDHLEAFSDYENRLPRGRTYVRNGSVCHLAVTKGKIEAKVSGSDLYNLRIRIDTLPGKKWDQVKRRCIGQIGSLVELLQGKLSDNVMEVVMDPRDGLFPSPDEITFECDCPDWAYMCKHVAAVLYGVGARLDDRPELLFALRGVDHEELIDADAAMDVSSQAGGGKTKQLAEADLSDVFGIDIALDEPAASPQEKTAKKKKARKKSAKTTVKKKAVKKKPIKTLAKKKAELKELLVGSVKKKAAKKKPVGAAVKKKAAKKKPTKTIMKKEVAPKSTAKKAAKKTKKKSAKKPAKKTADKKTTKKQPPKKSVKKKAAKKPANSVANA